VIDQVAWNESSLILNNILQNTQTLQLFTNDIKTESIIKSHSNAKLVAWVEEPKGSIKRRVKAQAVNVRVAEVE